MKKIDELDFRQVKRWLRFHTVKKVARRFNIHESTVLAIRGSKSYAEYREQVKAKHPPIQYSLADEILNLHRYVFWTPEYIKPKNARIALDQIKETIVMK